MIFSQKHSSCPLKEDPGSKQCVLVSALWSRREEQISRRSSFFPSLRLQSGELSPYQYSNNQQSFGEWYEGLLSADNEQIPRFRLFWQSKDDHFWIVLQVFPSVSKASMPPIHNSTTHGSATISLINQFDHFHKTFTGFNTKFNCHSLLLHDADDKAKNLHLQNKFVLTDH